MKTLDTITENEFAIMQRKAIELDTGSGGIMVLMAIAVFYFVLGCGCTAALFVMFG